MLPRLAQKAQQFGPYTLVERLAQGGMAAVYKAKLSGPSGFEKTVVVKALLPALCSHDELVELFCAEARLSAQLNHPNIVQVLDFGVEDGVPYLVMEFLDGWTLSQLRDRLSGARKGRFPVGAAVKIARDVCLALGYAHNFVDREGQRRQVIHRDVSPSNVMLCRDGSVKLLDFGIARVVTPTGTDLTSSFRGKYAYMAPEQVKRLPLDRRVDVFAAGTVLHEMLTGKRLFASVSELETLERVAAAQVTAPSGENPEVPRALDVIVKKALARDPNARYTSGVAMAEALDTLDALILSRRKMAQMLKQIFPEAWAVVCDVCGKQVFPGRECSECGTLAPAVEGSASDADVQPLPPAPKGPPKRAVSPPHLFVVPKLPARRDDDSVKMGLHPAPVSFADADDEPETLETKPPIMQEAAPVDFFAPTVPAMTLVPSLVRPMTLVPAVTLVPPPTGSQHYGESSPPDLRRGSSRLAVMLLGLGLLGLGLMLWWKGPPAAPTAAQIEHVLPEVKHVPAEAKPVPAAVKPLPIAVRPVVLVPTARPAHRHHHEHAAPAAISSSTVRDGRIVDPFAGAD